MLRAQYAIVAEFYREGQSGKFDVLGLFDRIFTAAVPAQHRHLTFVALLVADTEDDLGKKPFRFRFLTPSGQTLFEQRGEVDLKPGGGTWLASGRVNFEIVGLPIPEYGKYKFVLDVGGKEIATHPLSVVVPQSA